MAQHFWLSQRAMRLQRVALEFTEHHVVPKDLAVLIRYQTTNERAFQMDLATLLKLQQAHTPLRPAAGAMSSKEIANQQIGSVPQAAAGSQPVLRVFSNDRSQTPLPESPSAVIVDTDGRTTGAA